MKKKINALHDQAIIYGVDSLSDAEILAIAAGMEYSRTVSILGQIQFHDLMNHLDALGFNAEEKIRLQSIFLLNQRLSRSKILSNQSIHTPEEAASLFSNEIQHKTVEVVMVALLNVRSRVIRVESVATGTSNMAVISPKDIVRLALQHNTASVILGHNHPSGDPNPSQEDIRLTETLGNALKLFEIRLLDHIVIGNNSYVSFRQTGLMP